MTKFMELVSEGHVAIWNMVSQLFASQLFRAGNDCTK